MWVLLRRLVRALQYLNDQVERMVNEINKRGLENSTAIIISAKHGQSPQNPNQLTRIDDTPIINGANAACGQNGKPIVAFGTDDDAIMWWLTNTSQTSANCVRNYLWNHPATGVTYSGGSRTLQHSGLRQIYAGQAAAKYFGVPKSDPRPPRRLGRRARWRRLHHGHQDRRTRRSKPGRSGCPDPRVRAGGSRPWLA